MAFVRRGAAALLTAAGTAMFVSGITLLLLAVVTVPAAGTLGGDLVLFYLLLIVGSSLGGAALAAIGPAIRRAGARMQMNDAVLENAPPVVYLRPFAADAGARRTPPFRLGKVDVDGLSTHEENLARVFRRAGQFVAISAPWADASPLGALRVDAYDDWQRTAHNLITSASLVVVRCGMTPGIQWELRQVVECCAPQRVIILLRAGLEDARREHTMLAATLPHAPPPLSGIWSDHDGLAGICMFDEGWHPRLRLFPNMEGYRSLFEPIVPALTLAVQPVFARLGIPWKIGQTPLLTRMAIALAIFVTLVPLAFGWFIGSVASQLPLSACVFAFSGCVVLAMLISKPRLPAMTEIVAPPPVHPLYERERGLLRIVNNESRGLPQLIVIADGHRIAELTREDREVVLEIAVGRHLLTACYTRGPGEMSQPIECDVTPSGCATVLCSMSDFSLRPKLYLPP